MVKGWTFHFVSMPTAAGHWNPCPSQPERSKWVRCWAQTEEVQQEFHPEGVRKWLESERQFQRHSLLKEEAEAELNKTKKHISWWKKDSEKWRWSWRLTARCFLTSMRMRNRSRMCFQITELWDVQQMKLLTEELWIWRIGYISVFDLKKLLPSDSCNPACLFFSKQLNFFGPS